MKKQLLFLFGSGVSFPSKAPDLEKITKSLVGDDWVYNRFQYKLKKDLPNCDDKNDGRETRDYIKYIFERINPILICNDNREANYEDCASFIRKIRTNKTTFDPAFFSEHQRIKHETYHIYKNYIKNSSYSNSKYYPLYPISRNALDLIQWAVYNSLKQIDYSSGLEPIAKLYKNEYKIDICTLNHDLVLEQFLDSKNIPYSDGFIKSGDFYEFANKWENRKSNCVNIYKLHGSINYFEFHDETGSENKPIKFDGDPYHLFEEFDQLEILPSFLSGNLTKEMDYLFGFSLKMVHKFIDLLNQYDKIIISGYGWGDRGIDLILLDWITFNKKHPKILVLHRNKKDNLKRKAFWNSRYQSFLDKGILFHEEKWFGEANFEELFKKFPSFFDS